MRLRQPRVRRTLRQRGVRLIGGPSEANTCVGECPSSWTTRVDTSPSWPKNRQIGPILVPSLADDVTVLVASDGMVDSFENVGADAAVGLHRLEPRRANRRAPVSVYNGIECATRRAPSFWDTPLATSTPTLFAERRSTRPLAIPSARLSARYDLCEPTQRSRCGDQFRAPQGWSGGDQRAGSVRGSSGADRGEGVGARG